MRRNWLWFVVALVMFSTAMDLSAQKQKITFWAFGSEEAAKGDTGELWKDFYTKTFDQYMATHKDVEVSFAIRGYEAGGTTLFMDTAVAAGTPPDIYLDSNMRISKYYNQGLTADLSAVLSAADKKQYGNILKDFTAPDGKLWGVPVSGGYWDYIINKTLFDNKDLSNLLPKAPDYTWTTEQYLKAARAINDPANNVYATAFFAKSPSMDSAFNAFFGGFPGVEFYDQKTKTFKINSPKAIEALKFLHSLLDEDLIVPGGAGFIDDDIDPYWINQQIAMIGGANWYAKITNKAIKEQGLAPFEYILARYPNKVGAPPTPIATSDPDGFIVFKQKDPKKMTKIIDLIKYLQSPEIASSIAGGWSKVPLRADAKNPFGDKDQDQKSWTDAARKFGTANYYYNTGVPNFNEVRQAWAEARQAFLQKDANIQKIMDDFVKRANQIVKQ
jgi:multiple sugar transport system substrate-binding protein